MDHRRLRRRAARCATPEETVDGIFVRRFRNLHNGLAYHRQLYLPLGILKAPWHDLVEFDVVHIHSHRHLLEALVGAAALRRRHPLRLHRQRHGAADRALRADQARPRPARRRRHPRARGGLRRGLGGRGAALPARSASTREPRARHSQRRPPGRVRRPAAARQLPPRLRPRRRAADGLRRQDHAAQGRRRAAARPGAPARRRCGWSSPATS